MTEPGPAIEFGAVPPADSLDRISAHVLSKIDREILADRRFDRAAGFTAATPEPWRRQVVRLTMESAADLLQEQRPATAGDICREVQRRAVQRGELSRLPFLDVARRQLLRLVVSVTLAYLQTQFPVLGGVAAAAISARLNGILEGGAK